MKSKILFKILAKNFEPETLPTDHESSASVSVSSNYRNIQAAHSATQEQDTRFLTSGSGDFQDLIRHYHSLPPSYALTFQAALTDIHYALDEVALGFNMLMFTVLSYLSTNKSILKPPHLNPQLPLLSRGNRVLHWWSAHTILLPQIRLISYLLTMRKWCV